MRSGYYLLSCLFLGTLFSALCQVHFNEDSYAIKQYQEADSYYNRALNQGSAKKISDKQEESYNHLAIEKFQNFLQNSSSGPVPDSLRFMALIKLGELQHYFENFPLALDYYNRAIKAKKRLPAVPDSFLFKPYVFAGLIYYKQNQLDSAISYFKAAEFIQSRFSKQLTESERLYNNLGGIYYEYGDYQQAKNYFQKAAEVLSPRNPSYDALYINYKINLATVLLKLENFDQASQLYRSLLSGKKIYFNQIYNNLGLIELNLNNPVQALRYFNKVRYTDYLLVGLHNDMASAYLALHKFDSVKKYLQKALTENKTYNGASSTVDYGRTLKTYGDLEKQQGYFMNALHRYQQAIHQFYPAFKDSSLSANPQKFSGAFSYINLFHALTAKAEAFHGLYDQTTSLDYAGQELQTYQCAFKLIDYVERTYNSDEARIFLTKIKYLVHSKPIDIAYLLFQKTKKKKFLEDLYVLDQQNKASVLSFNNQLRTQAGNKDHGLLVKERSLRTKITSLSLKALNDRNHELLPAIDKQIRDCEIELGSVQEQLSSLVTSVSLIPSSDLLQKKFLDEKSAMVSFHLSDDKLTTLFLTKDSFSCLQQPLAPGFHQDIVRYIDLVKRSGDSKELSTKMYSILLGKLHLKGIERLLIIPDDELNYLSFESLTNAQGEYLLQHCSIIYQYSTALLAKQTIDFSHHQTLSFAPFTNSSFSNASIRLDKLPASFRETEELRGQTFIDSAATKYRFIKEVSSHKIIHLATHAVVNTANDSLSYIAFYPNGKNHSSDFLLYEPEIDNLPLEKTDLVLLSACETAAGSLVKGEGVMSLSRAFFYAGCPNVITSLWNANDFSTAYITTGIHQYLDKGYSIDQAVQKAKLDYLNDKSINPRMKAPFYWSNLIFIGNYTEPKSTHYGLFWLLVPMMLLLISIMVFLRKKASLK